MSKRIQILASRNSPQEVIINGSVLKDNKTRGLNNPPIWVKSEESPPISGSKLLFWGGVIKYSKTARTDGVEVWIEVYGPVIGDGEILLARGKEPISIYIDVLQLNSDTPHRKPIVVEIAPGEFVKCRNVILMNSDNYLIASLHYRDSTIPTISLQFFDTFFLETGEGEG